MQKKSKTIQDASLEKENQDHIKHKVQNFHKFRLLQHNALRLTSRDEFFPLQGHLHSELSL